jgi:hypothetical protein
MWPTKLSIHWNIWGTQTRLLRATCLKMVRTDRITCAAPCSAARRLLDRRDVWVFFFDFFHIVIEVSLFGTARLRNCAGAIRWKWSFCSVVHHVFVTVVLFRFVIYWLVYSLFSLLFSIDSFTPVLYLFVVTCLFNVMILILILRWFSSYHVHTLEPVRLNYIACVIYDEAIGCKNVCKNSAEGTVTMPWSWCGWTLEYGEDKHTSRSYVATVCAHWLGILQLL